jgi:hydroxymethylpyrimidine/phosphomethylpyrimidine kinase
VKLGMLANAEVIQLVADALIRYAPPAVVLDPVMVASSGARLLEPAALEALRTRLVPLATVLTPNLPEAELLLGAPIADEVAAAQALEALLALGAQGVLLKGGHMPGAGAMVDRYGQGELRLQLRHPRLAVAGHGTGCTLASAIAAKLALGSSPQAACEDATDYVHGALAQAYAPGRGELVVLDHLWRLRARG